MMARDIDYYLARMTPDNVWPAAHSADEAREALTHLQDPNALVLAWKPNGAHPHDDMLAAWLTLKLITESQARAASQARREADAMTLAAYRRNPPQIDDEQLHEMRNAFGPGETVVNIITGRTIQL